VDKTPDTEGRQGGSCLGLGCLSLVVAVLVGFVTWLIIDAATPCNCDGEPDDAWVESMSAVPPAFVVGLIILILFLIRGSRSNKRRD
jgi:hypothetical protein